jgi:hypothetical protein
MKKVNALAIALLLLLSLAACGGKAEPAKASIAGSWESEFGGYMYTYTFNADGTGNYDAAGTILQLTYADDGSKLSILFAGDTLPTELPYKLEGNKLTITDSFGTEVIYNRK